METCENMANIHITSNNIQMSEKTATKDLRTQERISCILDVNCEFSWVDKIKETANGIILEKKP